MRATRPTDAGNAHLERGERELAEKSFRAALESDPKDPSALVGLAKVLVMTGRKAEAIETCQRAATLYLEHGKAAKALEICRRVLKLDPGRPEAREGIADAFAALGRTKEALDELRLAREAHRKAEKLENVVRVLRRALTLTPEGDRSLVRIELAGTLAEGGNVSEALEEYRDEARLLEAVGVLEVIGNRASLKSGPAYSMLVTCLEKIVALDAKDVETRLRLGRYQLAGRPARAISTLQGVLRIDRRNVRALRLLDHVFLALGQFDKAALTFEEIRILDPSAFSGRIAMRDDASMPAALKDRLAEVDGLANRGLLDDAREIARHLVDEIPGSIPARMKLKEMHATGGNIEAALAQVVAAVGLALEAGDSDHAREVLQDGLRLSPLHPRLRESCVRVAEHLHIFDS